MIVNREILKLKSYSCGHCEDDKSQRIQIQAVFCGWGGGGRVRARQGDVLAGKWKQLLSM